ncbi:hypothetical protein OEZ85_006468 [Tetradesmus obliquus]|uniref:Uncharacterized protein n=1 Tax=Tetradesmus obliquus TaxID=3088 RepID=A0ABY8TYQ0_TETOB|nr:hypothetical protein OEZ85_006468 [Tetradesmus obliquus]
MVQPWWAAAVAVPVVVTKSILGARSRKDGSDSEREEDSPFVCERVCTSDRLLKKLGSLAKEPTRDTCVTVCGVSAHDACADACQRAVCSVPHQVPAWNDACLKRCTAECMKGRGAS